MTFILIFNFSIFCGKGLGENQYEQVNRKREVVYWTEYIKVVSYDLR